MELFITDVIVDCARYWMNSQLKTMLESMEGKGTKIAQLAREKVLKYKEENVKMQQQLDQMKTDADAQSSSAHSDLLNTLEKAEVIAAEVKCAVVST